MNNDVALNRRAPDISSICQELYVRWINARARVTDDDGFVGSKVFGAHLSPLSFGGNGSFETKCCSFGTLIAPVADQMINKEDVVSVCHSSQQGDQQCY